MRVNSPGHSLQSVLPSAHPREFPGPPVLGQRIQPPAVEPGVSLWTGEPAPRPGNPKTEPLASRYLGSWEAA